MKKSIYEKLEHLAERLAEIDGLLGGEHAARDMDGYRKLTRERSDIEPVVELFQAYRRAGADFSSAGEMLADPEMKELARAEQDAAGLDAGDDLAGRSRSFRAANPTSAASARSSPASRATGPIRNSSSSRAAIAYSACR